MLRTMPDAHDLHAFQGDPVDDHIGPDERNLARPSNAARPSAFWKMFESIAGGDDLHGDAGSRRRVSITDVVADVLEVRDSLWGEGYRHFGGEDSLSVPHESSQRRTDS